MPKAERNFEIPYEKPDDVHYKIYCWDIEIAIEKGLTFEQAIRQTTRNIGKFIRKRRRANG